MVTSKNPKIVVILGPTASGKTKLGAEICRKFNGEIISADSRQVFRELNLGTGKERLDIPQHLIDIVEPGERYTVVEWKQAAEAEITKLAAAGKLPVIVGGSSLYVTALIDNYQFAPEDQLGELRTKLEEKSKTELLEQLSVLNPEKAAIVDVENHVYLVRAVERALLGDDHQPKKGKPKYDVLMIGIALEREALYQNIDQRVDERIKSGMLEEVAGLLKQGVSVDWLKRLGLEYKFLTKHLQGELTLEEALKKLKFATHHFARRQLIWWRHRTGLHWVNNQAEALNLVKDFLA